MLIVKYFYRIGMNYHPGSLLISNSGRAYTIYDIKNAICEQIRKEQHRCICVYDIEILNIAQVA